MKKLEYKISQYPYLDLMTYVSEEEDVKDVLLGYNPELNTQRDMIDKIRTDDWKRVRWFVNKYDFLVRNPIINRAFYKFWEIANGFDIFSNFGVDDLILHCAEAPGGFIQGSNVFLKKKITTKQNKHEVDKDGFISIQRKHHVQKRIYTISLNKDLPQYKSYNLPSYNHAILKKHVCVTFGKDNSGDINNWDNIKQIADLADNQKFHIVTADGGFDEGNDFNNKEQLHYQLILSEIYSALYHQKQGGHFILKVFDIFTQTSVHLVYLLSMCYKDIVFYKPKTSRPTNSEKYIICKNFTLDEEQRKNILTTLESFYKILMNNANQSYNFRLFKELPSSFIDNIKAMNAEFVTNQCTHLQEAILLCNDKQFLENYDEKLNECHEKRKQSFNNWTTLFNLHL
jgi:23S rRNA U2552 (ribose-2'-O)-methylase RlmE/FtsJ